jgi:hypothetical protein
MLTTTTPLQFATTSVGVASSMNHDSEISQIPLEDFDPPKNTLNTTFSTIGTGNPA